MQSHSVFSSSFEICILNVVQKNTVLHILYVTNCKFTAYLSQGRAWCLSQDSIHKVGNTLDGVPHNHTHTVTHCRQFRDDIQPTTRICSGKVNWSSQRKHPKHRQKMLNLFTQGGGGNRTPSPEVYTDGKCASH